jgi:hypothetical protein
MKSGQPRLGIRNLIFSYKTTKACHRVLSADLFMPEVIFRTVACTTAFLGHYLFNLTAMELFLGTLLAFTIPSLLWRLL